MGCVFIPYLGLPRYSRVHTIHVSLPETWAKMKREYMGARTIQRKTRSDIEKIEMVSDGKKSRY